MSFEICQMTLLSVLLMQQNYTQIFRTKRGLKAKQKELDKQEDQIISTNCLIFLAECVLKNNVSEYNKTAIGNKIAPPYAILLMGYLENKILNSFVEKTFVWWPYINNIFMIWQHGEEKLKQFLKYFNSCYSTIKFAAEYSLNKVNFLHVEFIRCGNKLLTDLYIKPTGTHQYLEFSSCHLYHSKKSIPYSQALHYNRICSINRFYNNRCNQIERWLKRDVTMKKLLDREICQ